jgi:ATP-binding cassette, subfamily B, bacterial
MRLDPKARAFLRFCRRLFRYALRRWPGLLLIVATLVATTGLQALQPWPMAILVDHVFGDQPLPGGLDQVLAQLPGGSTRESLLAWAVAGTVIVFALEWVLELASTYARISFGQRMVYDLAADLLDDLQRLSLRFHARRRSGDSIRRVTRDSSCVSAILEDALIPIVTSLLSLGLMFSIMWRIDAGLTLLALAVAPLLVIVLRRYAGPLVHRSYLHQQAEGELYDIVEPALSAIPAIQAFGREADVDRRFRIATGRALAAELVLTDVQLKFDILVGLTVAAGTTALIWVGGQHVLAGQLTVGSVLVFVSYLRSLYGPLESMMYLSSTLNTAAGSARRVMEVLEAPREVTDLPGAKALPAPTRGHIRLQDVTVGYEPDRPVLHQVCLEVPAGQTVAIVGPTGAGKSTLLSLIPRFFDAWSGQVLVDGHDVRDVQLSSLRAQIALVLQEPFLFPLSIADNIAYGRPEASLAEIEAAARAANAHAFIARLPEGYDTLVGERGATLSGGERQRIAIARALLKDAPILILDEPTSALDAETEELLLEALERLTAGRTTLLIAHRLSTIRHAERIVALDHGRVAEVGSHAELLARNGLYARFYHLQFDAPVQIGDSAAHDQQDEDLQEWDEDDEDEDDVSLRSREFNDRVWMRG